jgi:hypothetical protein
MTVQSVGAALTYRYANPSVAGREAPPAQRPEVAAKSLPTAPPEPADKEPEVNTPAGTAEEAPPEQGDANGVLRLLMSGHFKGVADVRLRINFHDELQALQTEAAKTAAGDQVAAVATAVDAELAALSSAAGMNEEQAAQVADLQSAFKAALDEAAQGFQAAESPTVDALAGGIQEAFAVLVENLQPLLAPPAPEAEPEPEPVMETPPSGETEAPPAADAAPEAPSPLTGLQQAFETAMQQLREALAADSFLPELSPPSGRGVAYEKFLAIYHDLWAAPATAPPPAEEPVDIIA